MAAAAATTSSGVEEERERESLKSRLGTRLFEPSKGRVVVEPDGEGSGYWVGACSAVFDPVERAFYLYYRRRGPRPERGNRCFIIKGTQKQPNSDDLEGLLNSWSWIPVWQASKEDIEPECPSMEKAALVRLNKGSWRLYLSYVDPSDQRWRIDGIEAEHPSKFSVSKSSRFELFTAASTSTEGVKDPEVVGLPDGRLRMYITYVPIPPNAEQQRQEMHGTGDVLNTGLSKALTSFAESKDSSGKSFVWNSTSLEPQQGNTEAWDAYCTRITTVWNTTWKTTDGKEEQVVAALYDGVRTVEGNYEEKSALALSHDGGKTFERLSTLGPLLVSSEQPNGSLRYVSNVLVDDRYRYWFYEAANSTGAHEIRLAIVDEAKH